MFANPVRDVTSMINTHAIVKSLIATGFTEVQAEAITDAFVSGNRNLEGFVNKEQHAVIEKELGEVKQDTVGIKQDIVDIKSDITVLKQDMVVVKQRLGTVEQRLGKIEQRLEVIEQDMVAMRQDIAVTKQQISDIKHFMVAFFIANLSVMLAVLGLVGALFFKV